MLGFDENCGAGVQVNLLEENLLVDAREFVCTRLASKGFGQLANLFAFPVVVGSVRKSSKESLGQYGLMFIWFFCF